MGIPTLIGWDIRNGGGEDRREEKESDGEFHLAGLAEREGMMLGDVMVILVSQVDRYRGCCFGGQRRRRIR